MNEPGEPQPLKTRAAISLFSAYSIQFATTAVNLLSKLVLARLIAPEQWGLFAEAALIVTVAATLRDLGLRAHLLRESKRPYGNALLLQVIGSVILLVTLEVIAPRFTFFSPQLPAVLRLLAPWLLFTGFSTTAEAYIDRELVIQKAILPRVAELGLNIGVSIALAWQGWGLWSLVWGTLVSAAVYTVLIVRPMLTDRRFEWTLKHTGTLLNGSKYLFFLGVLGMVTSQADIAIVGGFLTPLLAGYYSMVYTLILKPSSIVELAIGRVILPVFAELSEDRERLGRLYRDATVLTYAVEVPLYAFTFFYPEVVVAWLLGSQWTAVAPIVQAMAFLGIVNPFGTYCWEIVKVLKKDRFFTILTLVAVAILTAGGAVLTRALGLDGMIAAKYCAQIVVVPMVWLLVRLFGAEVRRLALQLVFAYAVPFALVGLSRMLSLGPAGLPGLFAVGLSWFALLFPYRRALLSFVAAARQRTQEAP